MVKEIFLSDKVSLENQKYVKLPFVKDGHFLEEKRFPRWGMSLLSARSMRFRINEENSNRALFLSQFEPLKPISLELIHSKKVYNVVSGNETVNQQGDGMICANPDFLPVVTVADCVPIFLYDSANGVFGVVHSGWKGTGIIGDAIALACDKYGSERKNISVAIGPHIGSCCYIVDENRAEYFVKNFGMDCVENIADPTPYRKWNNSGEKLYRLSLTNANLSVLERAGISPENILVSKDCTCCNNLFGSFRRETSNGQKEFTVQAAFVGFTER